MTAKAILDYGGYERKGSGNAEVVTGGRGWSLRRRARSRILLIKGGIVLAFLAERESCALAALLPQ